MEEEKTFKCIQELKLPKYDDEEYLIEDEFFIVPVDSIWHLKDHASISDIRLEGDLGWVEMGLETFFGAFNMCFIEI